MEEGCEIIRMNNISSGLGLPTKFIRYNPDNKQFNKKHKENVLVNTIKENIDQEFMEDLLPNYLFQDYVTLRSEVIEVKKDIVLRKVCTYKGIEISNIYSTRAARIFAFLSQFYFHVFILMFYNSLFS